MFSYVHVACLIIYCLYIGISILTLLFISFNSLNAADWSNISGNLDSCLYHYSKIILESCLNHKNKCSVWYHPGWTVNDMIWEDENCIGYMLSNFNDAMVYEVYNSSVTIFCDIDFRIMWKQANIK